MTVDEKRAIQTLLIEEISQHTEDQPTLLIDVLLSGQGPQWVYRTLNARRHYAAQATTTFDHLLRALNGEAPAAEDAA